MRSFPFFSSLLVPNVTVATIATAGNVSLTAAQVWGGEIHRDPNGSNRTDTLPSAHDLAVAMSGIDVGSTIEIVIRNDADAAETITVAAGVGGTASGTLTIPQNGANLFRIRFTNIIYPAEAYEVVGLSSAGSSGSGSGDALVGNPLSQFAATSSAQLRGVISDETGAGAAVFAVSPVIVTPTIASFVNATHDHSNAAGGGTLTASAVGLGNVDNTSDATKNAAAVTLTNKTITTPTIASFVNAGHSHLNAAGGGTITAAAISDLASAAVAFSNKTGNISQWTNDSGYLSSVSAHNLLSATHGDTTAGTVARGDLVTGQGASAKWVRLAKGTANQVLAMDGTATDIVWATAGGGSGDVVGPSSSVDNTLVRFDSTTGKLVQGYTSNGPTVSDTGALMVRETAGESGVTITGAIQTSSFPALTITQTWNASGTTFAAIKANITSTASAAASKLIDLQVGSVSQFSVQKDGRTDIPTNSGIGYSITVSGQNPVGFSRNGSVGGLSLHAGGAGTPGDGNPTVNVTGATGATPAMTFDSATVLGWASSNVTQNADVKLQRDAANTLALRNTTTAQKARVYNTFTTVDTAGEWFDIDWITTANQCILSTRKGSSTGTLRGMMIGASNVVPIGFCGATPAAPAVLATGAGATADNIISALQTLGLVKQS